MFSSTVKIMDLNDYIIPANSCVVQESQLEKPQLIKQTEQKAEIKLEDCLACSGCLTTSETILLQEQSIGKLIEILNNKKDKKVVMLLSQQSIVSIQTTLDFSYEQTLDYFIQKANSMNIDYLVNINLFNEYICYLEYQNLLWSNFEKVQSSCECPGWIAYLEKVLKKDFFNISSQIITPQALASSFMKKIDNSLYTVFLAPCYDKKLEGFKLKKDNVPLIDLVVATDEFYNHIKDINYIKEKQLRIIDLESTCLQNNKDQIQLQFSDIYWDYKWYLIKGESNGYISYVVQNIQQDFQNVSVNVIQERNITTIQVCLNDQNKVVNLAYIYGFKNISNFIRKIKRQQNSYNYVEIMACPGGCIKGGGQLQKQQEEQIKLLQNFQNWEQNLDYKTNKKLFKFLEQFINKESLSYELSIIEENFNLKSNW